MSIENLSVVYVFVVIFTLIGILIIRRYWDARVKKEKLAAEKAEAEQNQKRLQDQQDNLGNRIFNAMVNAARLNPTGVVRVEKIPNNGTLGYTVVVGAQDDRCFTGGGVTYRGYHIISISVNLFIRGTNWVGIHTVESAYGPDSYYRMDRGIEGLIMLWAEKVSSYSNSFIAK